MATKRAVYFFANEWNAGSSSWGSDFFSTTIAIRIVYYENQLDINTRYESSCRPMVLWTSYLECLKSKYCIIRLFREKEKNTIKKLSVSFLWDIKHLVVTSKLKIHLLYFLLDFFRSKLDYVSEYLELFHQEVVTIEGHNIGQKKGIAKFRTIFAGYWCQKVPQLTTGTKCKEKLSFVMQ